MTGVFKQDLSREAAFAPKDLQIQITRIDQLQETPIADANILRHAWPITASMGDPTADAFSLAEVVGSHPGHASFPRSLDARTCSVLHWRVTTRTSPTTRISEGDTGILPTPHVWDPLVLFVGLLRGASMLWR